MKGSKDKYYIEQVEQPNEDSGDIITIILGTPSHGACIEIMGSPREATDRMMIILTALNKD